jgi:hypothetical protein
MLRTEHKATPNRPFQQSFPEMRILLLTENPVLSLGLEWALPRAGHTLLLCSCGFRGKRSMRVWLLD